MARAADDPAHQRSEVAQRLRQEPVRRDAHEAHHGHDPTRHGSDIRSFCLIFDRPLDWTAFGIWLTMLLHTHGRNVLRVKGILNVMGLGTPVVIHGVQHVVHPPAHLDRWPDDDRRSRIVFIVRGLEQDLIERSLAAFHRQAGGPGLDAA
jgi:G3E family GTPase